MQGGKPTPPFSFVVAFIVLATRAHAALYQRPISIYTNSLATLLSYAIAYDKRVKMEKNKLLRRKQKSRLLPGFLFAVFAIFLLFSIFYFLLSIYYLLFTIFYLLLHSL
jgi:uncharacterized membrane protein